MANSGLHYKPFELQHWKLDLYWYF